MQDLGLASYHWQASAAPALGGSTLHQPIFFQSQHLHQFVLAQQILQHGAGLSQLVVEWRLRLFERRHLLWDATHLFELFFKERHLIGVEESQQHISIQSGSIFAGYNLRTQEEGNVSVGSNGLKAIVGIFQDGMVLWMEDRKGFVQGLEYFNVITVRPQLNGNGSDGRRIPFHGREGGKAHKLVFQIVLLEGMAVFLDDVFQQSILVLQTGKIGSPIAEPVSISRLSDNFGRELQIRGMLAQCVDALVFLFFVLGHGDFSAW